MYRESLKPMAPTKQLKIIGSRVTVHLVDVSWRTQALPAEPSEAQIESWAVRLLDLIADRGIVDMQSGISLSISIVSSVEIANLNRTYRNKAEPTNVLAFPNDVLDERGLKFIGDIVICNDVVFSESEQFEKSLVDRYLHMLVHGLLHLCHFDHLVESERLEMEALEQQLLSELGVEHPYEVVDGTRSQ